MLRFDCLHVLDHSHRLFGRWLDYHVHVCTHRHRACWQVAGLQWHSWATRRRLLCAHLDVRATLERKRADGRNDARGRLWLSDGTHHTVSLTSLKWDVTHYAISRTSLERRRFSVFCYRYLGYNKYDRVPVAVKSPDYLPIIAHLYLNGNHFTYIESEDFSNLTTLTKLYVQATECHLTWRHRMLVYRHVYLNIVVCVVTCIITLKAVFICFDIS